MRDLHRRSALNLNLNVESRSQLGSQRFTAILSESQCASLPCDHVLSESNDCLVVPTLGSILPNWLLVIPRQQTINYVQWRKVTGLEPSQIVNDVMAMHDISSERAIWFEHGPANPGSIVGCGVDHAHLHIIAGAPFSFDDFVATSMRMSALNWERLPPAEVHRSLSDGNSYLMAASGNRGVIAENVDNVGSQFFRRVVATLSGCPDAWDYRTHPHLENVHMTLARFSLARHDAYRG